LIERGEIDPNERIGNVLPEFHVSSNAEISINELLMHTSGLPAWLPFYLLVEHQDRVTAEIARTLQGADQEPVTYSDLNFLTLASAIEHLTDSNLEQIVNDEIISPLDLRDTRFNPLADDGLLTRIAASEKGNEYEKQTCVELGYVEPAKAGTP